MTSSNLQKLGAILVALVLVFGLLFTGCGGREADVKRTEDGRVIVTFWHSTSGTEEIALQKIIDKYNATQGKEDNAYVELVYQGYEGTDKVILAYQNKDRDNAPDINQGLTSTIPSMKDLDWTVPVEQFLKDDPDFKDSLYPHMVRSVTFENEMVGLPFASSTMLLYYNVDALKEAGLQGPPETMDELATYIDALTVKDANGEVTRYGLNSQIKRYQLVNYLAMQGSFVGDEEGGRLAPMRKFVAGDDGTLDRFLDSWDQIRKLDGYMANEESINEEFAQGLTAMAIMSSSRVGTVEDLINGKFEFMTAPVPRIEGGEDWGCSVGGSCLILFDRGNDERLEAAWKVLRYCASPEAQATLSMASGRIPVNKATPELPEMQEYYAAHPQYKTSLDSMIASDPRSQEPLDLVYNEVFDLIKDTMQEFCDNKIDKQETKDRIVDGYNALLDEYHQAND